MGSFGSKDPLPEEIRLRIEAIQKEKSIKDSGIRAHRLMLAGKVIAKEVKAINTRIADARILITLFLTKAADAGSPKIRRLLRKVRKLRNERTELIDRAFPNNVDSDQRTPWSRNELLQVSRRIH